MGSINCSEFEAADIVALRPTAASVPGFPAGAGLSTLELLSGGAGAGRRRPEDDDAFFMMSLLCLLSFLIIQNWGKTDHVRMLDYHRLKEGEFSKLLF